MRLLLTAVIAAAMAPAAQAAVIAGGPGEDFGIYNVSTSAPVQVGTTSGGNALLAVTMRVTNISGNSDQDLNGIGAVTIGSGGSLHHEQAPNAIPIFSFPTPLESSFAAAAAPVSPVDSHFLIDPDLVLPGGDPSETISTVPSGVPVASLGGFPTAQTGFGGVLTASYAFANTDSFFDIAYLVFEDLGEQTAIEFALRPTNGAGQSEDLSGTIVLIPEPSTVLLAGLALVGFAARRR